jgi:hypothetical protein
MNYIKTLHPITLLLLLVVLSSCGDGAQERPADPPLVQGINGRVTNEAARAVASALVDVFAADSQFQTTGEPWSVTVRTDARGFFRISGVPAGTYSLLARKDDSGALITNVGVTEDEGGMQGKVDLQVTIKPLGIIEGTAALSDATAQAGIHVSVPGLPFAALTDGNGTFVLPGVPAGEHALLARYQGYSDATVSGVVVEAGSKASLQAPLVLQKVLQQELAISLDPAVLELVTGEQAQLTASVSGTHDTSVTWSTTGGTVAGNGNTITYTAPGEAGTYTVTAMSNTDPEVQASAAITVRDAATETVRVSLTPDVVMLLGGHQQDLIATVTGVEDTRITWSVTGGTLRESGTTVTYVAPEEAGTYTVTATSTAKPQVADSTTITVTTAQATINPSAVKLVTRESRTFTATVTGSGDTAVTWSATGGTISGDGNTVTYTAPDDAGTFRLAASSAADPRRTATATITVTAPAGEPVTVAAAGDIACDPADASFNGGLGTATNCRMNDVAQLMLDMPNLDAVLMLGDAQYHDATLEKFMASYDLSWGRLKEITYPILGDHEYYYHTADAAGYFNYFGERAGDPSKGYYSYSLGEWLVIAFNTNCDKIGGCGSTSPQGQWL